MSDLIDTTEMYLRTIYELGEEGVTPLRARIAGVMRLQDPKPKPSAAASTAMFLNNVPVLPILR